MTTLLFYKESVNLQENQFYHQQPSRKNWISIQMKLKKYYVDQTRSQKQVWFVCSCRRTIDIQLCTTNAI